MRVLALDMNLFPDRETVEAALAQLAAAYEVRRCGAPGAGAADSEWDQVLAEVRAADLVVTL